MSRICTILVNISHKTEYLTYFAVSNPQNMQISHRIGISVGRWQIPNKAEQKDLNLEKKTQLVKTRFGETPMPLGK